jgi:hypothetical protein
MYDKYTLSFMPRPSLENCPQGQSVIQDRQAEMGAMSTLAVGMLRFSTCFHAHDKRGHGTQAKTDRSWNYPVTASITAFQITSDFFFLAQRGC